MMVMDEADKLLSPEFQPLIEQIVKCLPKERQLLLFSATFPITGMVARHSGSGERAFCCGFRYSQRVTGVHVQGISGYKHFCSPQ